MFTGKIIIAGLGRSAITLDSAPSRHAAATINVRDLMLRFRATLLLRITSCVIEKQLELL